jgi:hypothetical protein
MNKIKSAKKPYFCLGPPAEILTALIYEPGNWIYFLTANDSVNKGLDLLV